MIVFPRPVAAVIFDMDGLLVDTERVYGDALVRACAAVGHGMTEAFVHSMIGVPGKECVAMIEDHFGPAFPMAAFGAEYDRLVAARLGEGIPARPGAAELVTFLAGEGVPLAIATSSRRPTVERYMTGIGLLDHFDAIVCREDVDNPKPAPDPFLAAAGRLGVAPASCLVLEDSYHGITGAHAAGTMPVMVPDLLVPTAEVRARCVAVVEDLFVVRAALAGAPGMMPANRMPGTSRDRGNL